MATAGDILHPTVHNHSVDASYIILGVVKAFTYIKWVSEDGKDRYDNYINNHERVVVTWAVIDGLPTGHHVIDSNYWSCLLPRQNDTTYDVVINTPSPTHKKKLKMLCKKNCCKLSGLNEYLCETIVSGFTYDINLGWQHKK